MIQSFADKQTKKIFYNQFSHKFPVEIQHIVKRKLNMIDASHNLKDLKIPPANHLKRLHGTPNTYSIRVNDQYRLIFFWENNHAYQVQLIDYH